MHQSLDKRPQSREAFQMKSKENSSRLRMGICQITDGRRSTVTQSHASILSAIEAAETFHDFIFIQIRTKEAERPGSARNRGFQSLKDKGVEWIAFVDDDVVLPPHYFSTAVTKIIENPRLEVFAGPNLTPPNSSLVEHFQGEILSSPWGTGPSAKRYRISKSCQASELNLTSCAVVLKTSILEHHRFPDDWVAGEETVFFADIFQNASGIYDPDLFVYHFRRQGLEQFFQQIKKYGEGRANAYWYNHCGSFLHFIPALYLILIVAFLFLNLNLLYISMAIYFVLNGMASLHLTFSQRLSLSSILRLWGYVIVFPCLHLSYALGLSSQILKLFIQHKIRQPATEFAHRHDTR
jgi:glycosyltransferase involved in cell wall biosynthesis